MVEWHRQLTKTRGKKERERERERDREIKRWSKNIQKGWKREKIESRKDRGGNSRSKCM